MDKPEGCPDAMYNIMKKCWSSRAADRPTFATIKTNLQDIQPFVQWTLVFIFPNIMMLSRMRSVSFFFHRGKLVWCLKYMLCMQGTSVETKGVFSITTVRWYGSQTLTELCYHWLWIMIYTTFRYELILSVIICRVLICCYTLATGGHPMKTAPLDMFGSY